MPSGQSVNDFHEIFEGVGMDYEVEGIRCRSMAKCWNEDVEKYCLTAM